MTVKYIFLSALLAVTSGGGAMAADYTKNPFTLVYDDAIMQN